LTAHILITGASGLIGTSARTYFESAGWNVSTLDKKSQDLDGRGVDFVGDIVEFDGLSDVLNGVDGVLHLAAVSRVIDAELDKAECTRVNVHGTSRVLEGASVAGCKWFIFGSSREVYGEPTSFPVKEEDGVSPINHYGHAKVEGERMVHEHCEQHGMAHSNLRFSNVYGHPGDHPTRLVNAFLRRALMSEPLEIHGGGQVFDFTHLDDTVSAVFKTAETLHEKRVSLPPIHVLPGTPVSIEDLARHALEITGSKSKVVYTEGRDYDVERFHGDPSRLRELLGHECHVDIRTGFEQSAALFRTHLATEDRDVE
jgi:nucleoside-diphosphate-sugar epimerase